MSKLSKKLATLATTIALIAAPLQPVMALTIGGGTTGSGTYTSGNTNSGTYNSGSYSSQDAYSAKWLPYYGQSNRGIYIGSSAGNAGAFDPGGKVPGGNSGTYNPGTFDPGGKVPGGNSGTYNPGTYNPGGRLPGDNSGTYNPGGKVPDSNRGIYVGSSSSDDGNRGTYNPGGSSDGGNRGTYNPGGSSDGGNRGTYNPDEDQEGYGPGYYYCKEVDSDELIFVKKLTYDGLWKVYYYSKHGDLIEVYVEDAEYADFVGNDVSVYDCHSISKELFELYVYPGDDDVVEVPVCKANYLNGDDYVYQLLWVDARNLDDYYGYKNIVGVWDDNQDGEITIDDCYSIDDDDDDDDEISECDNKPYPRDIDGHWGEIYIRRLFDLCIVEGYKDGYFKPNRNVTRAELVKMGLFAKGIEPNHGCYDNDCGSPFRDLDEWQGRWVRVAWDRGIIEGYLYNEFRPNKPITRAEAVKIVLATYGYSPLDVEKSFFNDVDGWSKGWIERAHEIGLVQGIGNGNFDPDRHITRAEAAKIIAKMIEHWDTSVRRDNQDRDGYEDRDYYYDEKDYYCDRYNRYDPDCYYN